MSYQDLVLGSRIYSLQEWVTDAITVSISGEESALDEQIPALQDMLHSGSLVNPDRSTPLLSVVNVDENRGEEATGFGAASRFLSPRPSKGPSTPYGWPFDDAMPGLTVLLAGTGGGKTSYLTSTLKPDVVIRVSEPFEEIDQSPRTLSVDNLITAFLLAHELGAMGLGVAIDSMHAVTDLGGTTKTGGIDSGAFGFFRVVNNWLAANGVGVVGTINPMLVDVGLRAGESVTVLDYFATLTEASVMGVIYLKRYQPYFAFRSISGRTTLPSSYFGVSNLDEVQSLVVTPDQQVEPDTNESHRLISDRVVEIPTSDDNEVSDHPIVPGPEAGFGRRTSRANTQTVVSSSNLFDL